MRNYSSTSKILAKWWTGGLLIGLLAGCATPPERAVQPAAAAADVVLPEPLAEAEADGTTPPAGNTAGPRLRRAAKPGLQGLLPAEPEPVLDADAPDAVSLFAAEPLGADDSAPADAEADLWQRIRNGFALAGLDHPRVRTATSWYARHPRYFERITDQAEPYLHYIVGEVERRGMPSELALLPVVESAFQPYAYSSGRAAGLWQFIPDTGRRFGLKLNWWYDGRRDVMASTQAALDYLQYLHGIFDGDWLLALAAYNSGEGTVARAIRENRRLGRPADYWSLKLPRETEEYVPRLLAISAIVAAPAALGIELRPIADETYLTPVESDTQLDFAIAAELAEMSVEELHRLNPAYNRWATDPEGPHRLLLPADKAAAFSIGLAALAPEKRVRWRSHRVQRGETLAEIARRYHTTGAVLRRLNDLADDRLRAGDTLLVPVAAKDAVAGAAPLAPQRTHTVAAGDTLWQLARRHGVTVDELARWNGISSRAPLRVGQRLVVRNGTVIDRTAVSLIDTERKIVYTVRRGDTLAGISKRYNVPVSQLQKWNGLEKKTRLRAGQRLTVHIDMLADAH